MGMESVEQEVYQERGSVRSVRDGSVDDNFNRVEEERRASKRTSATASIRASTAAASRASVSSRRSEGRRSVGGSTGAADMEERVTPRESAGNVRWMGTIVTIAF